MRRIGEPVSDVPNRMLTLEMEDVLRLVDADLRHHLRGSYGTDAPALLRSHAVQAVYRVVRKLDGGME
jgi:hypothetical protein